MITKGFNANGFSEDIDDMRYFIVEDQHGYWFEILAQNADDAIRIHDGLAPEADLDYARSRVLGTGEDISIPEFNQHNCRNAQRLGSARCQCGQCEEYLD